MENDPPKSCSDFCHEIFCTQTWPHQMFVCLRAAVADHICIYRNHFVLKCCHLASFCGLFVSPAQCANVQVLRLVICGPLNQLVPINMRIDRPTSLHHTSKLLCVYALNCTVPESRSALTNTSVACVHLSCMLF